MDLKPFASKDGLLYTGYIVIEDEDIFFWTFSFFTHFSTTAWISLHAVLSFFAYKIGDTQIEKIKIPASFNYIYAREIFFIDFIFKERIFLLQNYILVHVNKKNYE